MNRNKMEDVSVKQHKTYSVIVLSHPMLSHYCIYVFVYCVVMCFPNMPF